MGDAVHFHVDKFLQPERIALQDNPFEPLVRMRALGREILVPVGLLARFGGGDPLVCVELPRVRVEREELIDVPDFASSVVAGPQRAGSGMRGNYRVGRGQ